MTISAFTSPISASQLNTNFDDATSALTSQAILGQVDGNVFLLLTTAGQLASAADISLRSIAWTPTDDQELRIAFIRATDTAANAITLVLVVENSDTAFLVDQSISIPLTTVNGTIDSRTAGDEDYRTTTGIRVKLLKGVRYRLTMVNVSGATIGGPLEVCCQTRSVRRRQ